MNHRNPQSHIGFNSCISIVAGKHLEVAAGIIMTSVPVFYILEKDMAVLLHL